MLNNDTILHPLPGTLQQRIENAKNQIIEMEAENALLKKYYNDEKDKINGQHAIKKGLENELKSLTGEVERLTKEVAENKEILDRITHQVADARHEFQELTRESAALKVQISESTIKADAILKNLDEAHKTLHQRQALLDAQEVAHTLKVEKLKAALS